MKICILNSVHPFTDTRVKRVAETLAEAGHQITIIAPVYEDVSAGGFEERFQISAIGIERSAQGNFAVGRSLRGILKTIMSRIQISFDLFRLGKMVRADVYHCNEMDSWIVGILLKFRVKAKVVFDVHEYYPARVAEAVPPGFWTRSMEWFVCSSFRFFSRFSDGLIFVNQSLVELYKFFGRHIVLRNCVRLADFQPLPVDLELRQAYQDRTIVVHIGSLREGYGAAALLETLPYITDPEVLFLILGGAADGFSEEVERNGYGNQVQVIEQLPFQDMLAYLELAEIGITLLQPLDKNMIYSLGRKFLEYIAAGIPVLAPDFPEYRALIEEYQLGLAMDPENPQEIAALVTRLAADPGMRTQLGDNAARAFAAELNWESESGRLVELYNDLNAKTGRPDDLGVNSPSPKIS